MVAGPPPRPAVPPRPAAMYQPQVVYYSPPPPPPMPLQRIVAMAVILGFGAVGITAAILKVIKVTFDAKQLPWDTKLIIRYSDL